MTVMIFRRLSKHRRKSGVSHSEPTVSAIEDLSPTTNGAALENKLLPSLVTYRLEVCWNLAVLYGYPLGRERAHVSE